MQESKLQDYRIYKVCIFFKFLILSKVLIGFWCPASALIWIWLEHFEANRLFVYRSNQFMRIARTIKIVTCDSCCYTLFLLANNFSKLFFSMAFIISVNFQHQLYGKQTNKHVRSPICRQNA